VGEDAVVHPLEQAAIYALIQEISEASYFYGVKVGMRESLGALLEVPDDFKDQFIRDALMLMDKKDAEIEARAQ
jgi:hypothetical protein